MQGNSYACIITLMHLFTKEIPSSDDQYLAWHFD